MTNDLENEDDVSAMMEELWGPRTEIPAHLAPGSGSRSYADGAADDPDDVGPATADHMGSPSSKHRGSADDSAGDVRQELALIESWERESAERLAALEHAVGSELERLSLILDGALKQGDARAAAVAAELSRREEESIGRDEFAVLRSELRDELSRNMVAAQAELQRRVALLDAAIDDARTHMSERLDQMAILVSTDAARAAEQATARAGIAAEPLHRDLRALQEQVQQISTVVAALQQRSPAS